MNKHFPDAGNGLPGIKRIKQQAGSLPRVRNAAAAVELMFHPSRHGPQPYKPPCSLPAFPQSYFWAFSKC
jgi:hypothetical protein